MVGKKKNLTEKIKIFTDYLKMFQYQYKLKQIKKFDMHISGPEAISNRGMESGTDAEDNSQKTGI